MWITLFIIAALGVIVYEHLRLLKDYRRPACRMVTATRCAMLLAAALFLSPPYRTVRTPLHDRLKLAVAVDASASMNVKEGGASRREIAEKLLNSDRPQAYLSELGRTEYHLFSNAASPFQIEANRGYVIPELPGNTKLGDVLAEFLKKSRQGTPLSAVLLFTDGRNNDGSNPLDAAKQFAAAKIPVSVIGIGGGQEPPDVAVKSTSINLKVTRNQPFELTAEVSAKGKVPPNPITVELVSDGQTLERTTVTPTAESPVPVHFKSHLPSAGFHTFMFRIIPPPGDSRADNDADFVSVDVTEPPVFKTLYLAYGLDWEWRFLNIACSLNRQLALSAIIQTGKERFYAIENDGSPDGKRQERMDITAFPSSTDAYRDYDLIIANSELFLHLDEPQRTALRSFAEYKGGGLVIRGFSEGLPDDILELLPAKSFKRVVSRMPLKLHVLTDLVYRRDTAKALQPTQGLWLEAPATIDVITEPRRSTRDIIRLNSQDGAAVAAVHAYGAGRIAFIGISETWRWAMAGPPLNSAYSSLWNHLIVWLAETARPIIRIADNGSHVTAGESRSFEAEILGNDFRPAADAKVTARFIAPNGVVTTVPMLPSLDDVGRYAADFTPAKAGEYRMEVTAEVSSHAIRKEGAFLASTNSRELEDTSANVPLAQDIARITGGKFFTPESYLSDFANILVSPNVPVKESSRPAVPRWMLFAFFVLTSAFAWWARRRLGLK